MKESSSSAIIWKPSVVRRLMLMLTAMGLRKNTDKVFSRMKRMPA